MTTQDQARQQAVQGRLHEEHRHETMLERAEETLESPNPADQSLAAQAREHGVQQRQHEEHLHETMLERATPQPNE